MTFNEVLSQTITMLQQHGCISYRALKRQFALDDTFLENLTYEFIALRQRAVDQVGTVLVWTGDTSVTQRPCQPHRRPYRGSADPHRACPGAHP